MTVSDRDIRQILEYGRLYVPDESLLKGICTCEKPFFVEYMIFGWRCLRCRRKKTNVS